MEKHDPPHSDDLYDRWARLEPWRHDWLRIEWPWPEVNSAEALRAKLDEIGISAEEFKQTAKCYHWNRDAEGFEWLREL